MFARKLKAVWDLTRLEHGLIYALGVLIALVIAYRGVPGLTVAAAGIVGSVLAEMGAFALNDYFDVEVDIKNNRTDRPIVRGDIGKNEALALGIATSVLSVVAIYFMNNPGAIAVVIVLILFGVFYNAKLKEYGIWGNIYISFTMASPFLFGSFLFAQGSQVLLVISLVAFLIGLGREIMKGIMDMEGDALRDVRTVARTWGPDRAKYLAVILYAAGMILAPVPLILSADVDKAFHMNPVYAVFSAAAVLILVYVCVTLLKSHDIKTIGKARKTTLIAMAVALTGVLITALL